jgi:hypothetical protein
MTIIWISVGFLSIYLLVIVTLFIWIKITNIKIKKQKIKYQKIMSVSKTILPFYHFIKEKIEGIKLRYPNAKVVLNPIEKLNKNTKTIWLCFEQSSFVLTIKVNIDRENKQFIIDAKNDFNFVKISEIIHQLDLKEEYHESFYKLPIAFFKYIVEGSRDYYIATRNEEGYTFYSFYEDYKLVVNLNQELLRLDFNLFNLNKVKAMNLLDFISKKIISAEEPELAIGFDAVNRHFYKNNLKGSFANKKVKSEIESIIPFSFKMFCFKEKTRIESKTFQSRIEYKIPYEPEPVPINVLDRFSTSLINTTFGYFNAKCYSYDGIMFKMFSECLIDRKNGETLKKLFQIIIKNYLKNNKKQFDTNSKVLSDLITNPVFEKNENLEFNFLGRSFIQQLINKKGATRITATPEDLIEYKNLNKNLFNEDVFNERFKTENYFFDLSVLYLINAIYLIKNDPLKNNKKGVNQLTNQIYSEIFITKSHGSLSNPIYINKNTANKVHSILIHKECNEFIKNKIIDSAPFMFNNILNGQIKAGIKNELIELSTSIAEIYKFIKEKESNTHLINKKNYDNDVLKY